MDVNRTGDDWILWGFHYAWQPTPIKLTGGTLDHCHARLRERTAAGWSTAIYREGIAPTGLRDLAREVLARAA